MAFWGIELVTLKRVVGSSHCGILTEDLKSFIEWCSSIYEPGMMPLQTCASLNIDLRIELTIRNAGVFNVVEKRY